MTIYVTRSRGATENQNGANTLLKKVTDRIKAAHPDVVVVDVVHSASISVDNATRDPLAPSGDNSATQIVNWQTKFHANLKPTDHTVDLAYSLGCVGLTRWRKQALSPRSIMTGCIASPSRRESTSYGTPYVPGAAGIYSDNGTGAIPDNHASRTPHIEIAYSQDVMATCWDVSPLRSLSGPVMAASISDPGAVLNQLANGGLEAVLLDVANAQHWLDWKWWAAAGQLDQFMTSDVHTGQYSQKHWIDSIGKPVSGIELMARMANWRITQAKAGALKATGEAAA